LIHWLLAIGLVAAGLGNESVCWAFDVAEVAGQVSVDSYTDYIQNGLYTQLGGQRYSGLQHDSARDGIQEKFEGFGLTTSLDPFLYLSTECYNVVGILPGVLRPEEIYIVGAHYDTVASSPGAWDNASGVAGVLEAARVLSPYLFESTIVFIAFDREEPGLKGSTAYANEHIQDDIRAMVNLDCIAYRPYQPDHPDYNSVLLWYAYRRTDVVGNLTDAFGVYAGLTCAATQGTRSDHVPFDSAGFDSTLVIARGWASNPFLHTWLDSVDMPGYIDYAYGTQITRGVVGYLASYAGLEPVRTLPDFNADWKVDIEDLEILIEHWDRNDPPFDIAPPPFGDGIVDIQDLEGLMHYWDQNIPPDPTLAAHWRLDEPAGVLVADSAGSSDGALVGDPVWQPGDGQIGGALLLDGADDYVATQFILNPSEGPFSVFAWVKGGAPGQVILSQAGGANWLAAGDPNGVLKTDLKSTDRQARGLTSTAVITDDAWHRVGFVRDGTSRILYVDDVEVRRDTHASPAGSTGSLSIGTGTRLAPSTFWSGLIDDVRIYDRAVTP
jgi:hypothetical protein